MAVLALLNAYSILVSFAQSSLAEEKGGGGVKGAKLTGSASLESSHLRGRHLLR